MTDSVVVNGQTVIASVPAGLSVSIEQAEPATYPLLAADFDFGALDVEVGGLVSGSAVRVSVSLPSRVDTVRKLIGGEWMPFPYDGETGARVSADGRTVTVDLRDGGRGDLDGLANGVVVDPLALGSNVGAVPTLTLGQSFSHQLLATGGVGAIEWSVLSGTLPPGITLDGSGLISGTPSGPGGWLRVQASDGATAATRLLGLAVISGPSATSAGAPLPEGSAIRVAVNQPVNQTTWVGDYAPNGDLPTLAASSVAEGPGLGSTGPFAHLLAATFPNPVVSPDGDVAVIGPLVMDAETGATLATLALAEPVASNGTWFSPNGALVAVRDTTAAAVRVFETTNWTEVRSIAITAGSATHGIIWSPESTELVVNPPGPFLSSATPINVPISSATNPAADRAVNVINPVLDTGAPNTLSLQCQVVLDWSVTGRLALGCGPHQVSSFRSVVTTSATDGSGVRIVAPLAIGSTSPAVPLRIYGWQGGAKFSPSGSRLVLDAFECPDGSLNPATCTTRLVLASDTANSALTGLTEPLTGVVTLPVGWR